ncbi:MAG TPA: DUF4340 domain-containing protein, partial [Chthoniobacterales bacterium]|nr:DUF4340 domain-containing protein [Chthoniobacterales bacterium]
KISELLNAAASLKVFDVIYASELGGGRDLDTYGLDKPRSQIDLRGDGPATLYFGKEAAGENRVYVRRGDSKDVFIVSDQLQQLAFRNPQDFRDRRLTNLSADRVDKFSIKRGAGEVVFQRGGHGWEIVRPLRARADDAAVEKLLGSLLGLQIADFIADESDDLSAYGLAEPRAELVLSVDGESRPVALRIGADAGPNAVIAQFTARDSVYHLPKDAWTLLQADPDGFRDRSLTDLNLDTVDAVRFENGSANWTIERDGDAWKSAGKGVTDETMEHLAQALTGAKVSAYLPLTAKNLADSGLDHPAGKIAFDAWLSENTPETTAGRHPVVTFTIGRRDGDKAYVRVDENPEICVIPASVLDAVPASPAGKGN